MKCECECSLRDDDKKMPKVGASGCGKGSKYRVDDDDSAVSTDDRMNPSSPKPNSSLDCNGFSHLEWSASVPYNLAEEPDEVGQGRPWNLWNFQ